jgi:hypothetical protein
MRGGRALRLCEIAKERVCFGIDVGEGVHQRVRRSKGSRSRFRAWPARKSAMLRAIALSTEDVDVIRAQH